MKDNHLEQQDKYPSDCFDPPLLTRLTRFTDNSALYVSEFRTFLLTLLYISRITISKALLTFVESRADVSMKNNPSASARLVPSSTVTSLMFSKSHLFPTSIIATVVSEWAANGLNEKWSFKQLYSINSTF